jgi:hypothetical protein
MGMRFVGQVKRLQLIVTPDVLQEADAADVLCVANAARACDEALRSIRAETGIHFVLRMGAVDQPAATAALAPGAEDDTASVGTASVARSVPAPSPEAPSTHTMHTHITAMAIAPVSVVARSDGEDGTKVRDLLSVHSLYRMYTEQTQDTLSEWAINIVQRLCDGEYEVLEGHSDSADEHGE